MEVLVPRRLELVVADISQAARRCTIPMKKNALFQADEAALKRGAISGCWALNTIRLNRSS